MSEEIMAAIRRVLTPEYVAECVHMSLRKGCEGGMSAHRAISDLRGSAWLDAMELFTEGLLADIEQEIQKGDAV